MGSMETIIKNIFVAHISAKRLNHTCRARSLPCKGSPLLSVATKIGNAYLPHMQAKWVNHGCYLLAPECSLGAQKIAIAAWPICGLNGYINPTDFGNPNAWLRHKNLQWLASPCSFGPFATLEGAFKIQSGCVPRMWAQQRDYNQKMLAAPPVGKVETSPLQ